LYPHYHDLRDDLDLGALSVSHRARTITRRGSRPSRRGNTAVAGRARYGLHARDDRCVRQAFAFDVTVVLDRAVFDVTGTPSMTAARSMTVTHWMTGAFDMIGMPT
jgi:hypothetical protein